MIQFKRGKSDTWRAQETPLADGQPGFDKDRQKLKIGNGKDSWDKLPNVSGLRLEEILESEEKAKKTLAAKTFLNPVGAFLAKALKLDDRPVFTYGTEAPNENTIGQVYLQHYDAEPELDYIVDKGTSNGWYFQKWHSGFARCNATFEVSVSIKTAFEQSSLYCSNSDFSSKSYPFTFTSKPTEVASLVSTGNIVWLAGKTENSKSETGKYSLISPSSKGSAKYYITFDVSGYWK